MTATRSVGEEWIGGAAALSQYVTEEGDAPFRPEAFVWLDEAGLVVGTATFRPGEAAANAVAHFRETTRTPVCGPPRVPARVRVASEEVAAALRLEVGRETEVVCAPTPELDEVFASLDAHLSAVADGETEDATYLTAGLTPDVLARLFRAAAAFYRAHPWKVLPSDDARIAVTIRALDVHDARLSVIGQMGESHGLVLFQDHSAYERFIEVTARATLDGKPPQLPPHLFLELVSRDDLDENEQAEIAEHGWEIAGERAYPLFIIHDEDGIPRPPTAREVAVLEAVALAVVELIEVGQAALVDAFVGDEPLAKTFDIETSRGRVGVAIAIPAPGTEDVLDADPNPYAEHFDIHDVDTAFEDGDEDVLIALEEALLDRFARSAEAEALDPDAPFWAATLLEHARVYHDVPVTQLTPEIVDEVVFVDIPRKVSCEPAAASEVVATLRAFFAYLGRAHGLTNVARCASVVGAGAEAELRECLSDQDNFGLAKSLFMSGKAAGFEMTDVTESTAWSAMMSNKLGAMAPARPLLGSLDARGPRPSEESRAKKKSKRKAQRAGRRKGCR